MPVELYKQVALTRDVPEAKLYESDVAVLVDFVEHPSGGEQGAILEVFTVLGESIAVVTVPVSAAPDSRSNPVSSYPRKLTR